MLDGPTNHEGKTALQCVPAIRHDVKEAISHAVKKESQDHFKGPSVTLTRSFNHGKACEKFFIDFRFCHNPENGDVKTGSFRRSVYDIIYSPGSQDQKLGEFQRHERAFFNFTRLNGSQPRLKDTWRWVHIPSNNMTWIIDLIKVLYQSEEDRWYMRKFIEDNMWARREGHSKAYHRIPHAEGYSRPESPTASSRQVSLVVPYIDFESEQYLNRTTTDPETLDRSYYQGLDQENLAKRDIDQVVFKWFKSLQNGNVDVDRDSGTEHQDMRPKLLMVHQLWLWKLDERTIITALPQRWHDGSEDTLFDMILSSLTSGECKSPDSLIHHVLLQCLKFPDEFYHAGVHHHILDIFQSWIASQTNSEVLLFQDFRRFLKKSNSASAQSSHDDNDNALSIEQEISIIYEVKDILEELFILRQLFSKQKELVESFYRISPSVLGDIVRRSRIDAFIDGTKRLEEMAKRTLDSLDYLVSMKQTQSSLNETKLAYKQADVANLEAKKSRKLNNYIMLFTIVTVAFTPLSFMTSLFALTISEFPHNDDGEARYTSSWITSRLCEYLLDFLSTSLMAQYSMLVKLDVQYPMINNCVVTSRRGTRQFACHHGRFFPSTEQQTTFGRKGFELDGERIPY
ncbi:hypothetical protein B0T17DRAFT_346871 [Bombardia bombarda]|uniref:Uncharacterized protein n=1 Tax=Bombardia bombarda TaxID=252184 RepID=A0AA39WHM6_9PEZI|nr:hypothetical protein B0T17DRAFT_346871 [Bombardia bombarda]